MPETALTGRPAESVAEPRRTPLAAVPVWDPDGPSTASIAPALWEALREAVLWAEPSGSG